MAEALRTIHAEHGSLWRLLMLLDELNQELRDDAVRPNRILFERVFQYLESYADQFHHPKEDDYLFAALRRRAPEAEALIDELQGEHAKGAGLLGRLRRALLALEDGGTGPRDTFRALITQYVELERAHIKKEEARLLPLARERLTADDWVEIDRAFADNDDPLFGESARTEFRELRRQIARLAPAPLGLGMEQVEAAAAAPEEEPVLEVAGLSSHYGRIQALRDINLRVRAGELVALVGANGAGKTTLLRTISGLQAASAGTIRFRGRDITRLPAHRRAALGICQSPEGRQVFGPLAVEDNLRLGAYGRGTRKGVAEDLERVYRHFPVLKEKRRQAAGTLSGGQQQMLAIGRALMGRPQLLLLDEPSLGLAPLLVEEIFNVVRELKRQGITLFMVEQNAYAALGIADTGYVIETGATVLSGRGPALLQNERVKAAYLGM